MILVVSLSITKDGIAWKFHSVSWSPPTIDFVATPIDEATEIAAPLARMHAISVGSTILVLTIDEGDL
jgi:hypothetical protein